MSDLSKLFAELEAATEGSRELDYAIANKIGWRFNGEHEFKEYGVFWRDATTDEWKQLPWWTTSLDAALTLVPEGYRCSLDIPGKEGGRNHATVVKYSQVLEAVNLKAKPEEIIELWNHSYAATPFLAMCVAALRARQAMEEAG